MGYSARYHAASLAAVFLALAVGDPDRRRLRLRPRQRNGRRSRAQPALGPRRARRADRRPPVAACDAERTFELGGVPRGRRRPLRGEPDRDRRASAGSTDRWPRTSRRPSSRPARRSREIAVVREAPDLGAIDEHARRQARQLWRSATRTQLTGAGRRLTGQALVRGSSRFDALRRRCSRALQRATRGVDGS